MTGTDRWCTDCPDQFLVYRGVMDFQGWSFHAWVCNECGRDYTNLICPDCGEPVEYTWWPAVDPETGDHLGDYEVWRCESCAWSGEKPRVSAL